MEKVGPGAKGLRTTALVCLIGCERTIICGVKKKLKGWIVVRLCDEERRRKAFLVSNGQDDLNTFEHECVGIR